MIEPARLARFAARWVLLACALAGQGSDLAHAEVLPVATGGDPHIQEVAYDPHEVVAVHIATGYVLTIVFSPDERIETVVVGNSADWQAQVNHRADQLVIKPVGSAGPSNMTVISDQRTYAFSLTTELPLTGVQPFVLSFNYPRPHPADAAPAETGTSPTLFKLRGARALRPSAMSDDGQFTSIAWPKDATLPAIYREDAEGHRALVNGVMRDGVFVIEGTSPRFVFVLGSQTATASRIEGPKQP